MAILYPTPAFEEARTAIAMRMSVVAVAPQRANGSATPSFVEYPALPLNDTDRDAFLELIEEDVQPNQALLSGAEWFKSLAL